MTEEQIKEQLSRHFVELVASRSGFKCASVNPDHGCDLHITRALYVEINGTRRLLDTGEILHVQLKSTCESSVVETADAIKYDLEAKTFNDLVHRRNQATVRPLILVLLVLPDDQNEWLRIEPGELLLRRTAYWYYPEAGLDYTENTSKVRITIPRTNVMTLDFVREKFAEHFS